MESSLLAEPHFGFTQKLLFILCGGGWGISMAMQIGIGVVMNEVHYEWGISYSQQSVLPIGTMIGEFIGAYFWGAISDRYGRMASFKKVLFFVSLGCGLATFCPEIWTLSACFFIAGFGIGGSFTVDGTVFLEYIPLDKGYLLTGISALMALGAAISPGIAWLYNSLKVAKMWRGLTLSLALIALLLAIPRCWIKETPQYLHFKKNVSLCMSKLKSSSRFSQSLLQMSNSSLNENPKKKHKTTKQQLLALFRKPLRMYTIVYILIWWNCTFALSAMANYMPVLMERVGLGLADEKIYESMFYQQLAGVPGVVLATYLVNSCLGRKQTLTFALCISGGLIFGFMIGNYFAVFFT